MTTSYNGWSASTHSKDFGGLTQISAGGVGFPPGVRSGPVAVVLGYVVAQLNKRVEKAVDPGCWGYNYRKNRNANNLSCHASATAVDYNAPKHPNNRSGTFSAKQVAVIREILAEVDHVVRWGGDFHGTKDEMHFEIVGDLAAVTKVANKITSHQSAAPTKTAAAKPIAPLADPRLHQGVQGQRVLDVQNALLRKGYKPDPAEMKKGLWGPGTDRAYRQFQKDGKRNPDGITWAADWAALRK